ncbi:MAG TPA: hypothetical protein VIP56_06990 [Nitrososphaeraceae archaeon]|jgi:hypothetical protein
MNIFLMIFDRMQSSRAPLKDVLVSKTKLFAVVSLILISVLAVPVILPHIRHPSMIYHILLHVVSIIIAVFLGLISFLAYSRTGGTRLILMTGGFSLLAIIEFLYLFHATANIEDIIIPIVDVELSHLILLAMLTLFGIGVLKVNK